MTWIRNPKLLLRIGIVLAKAFVRFAGRHPFILAKTGIRQDLSQTDVLSKIFNGLYTKCQNFCRICRVHISSFLRKQESRNSPGFPLPRERRSWKAGITLRDVGISSAIWTVRLVANRTLFLAIGISPSRPLTCAGRSMILGSHFPCLIADRSYNKVLPRTSSSALRISYPSADSIRMIPATCGTPTNTAASPSCRYWRILS
jgi:hypothetical protein